MKLDLSPLSRAISRLKDGYDRYQLDITDEQIRDGLVQRFEFTYELSHKMLKRYLESTAASPNEFDNEPFQYLIRSANEKALLRGDWLKWRSYREMRSKTSHTYDEKVALEVVSVIPDFIEETDYLQNKLKELCE